MSLLNVVVSLLLIIIDEGAGDAHGSFRLIKTRTFGSSLQITTIKRVRLRWVFLLLSLVSDNTHTLECLL